MLAVMLSLTLRETCSLNTTLSMAKQSGVELVTAQTQNALEQIDQLSLVTHYTGVGCNKIRGNPEGDFKHECYNKQLQNNLIEL